MCFIAFFSSLHDCGTVCTVCRSQAYLILLNTRLSVNDFICLQALGSYGRAS